MSELVDRVLKKQQERYDLIKEFHKQDREYFTKQGFEHKAAGAYNQEQVMILVKEAYEAGKNFMDNNWADYHEDVFRKTQEKIKELYDGLIMYMKDISY